MLSLVRRHHKLFTTSMNALRLSRYIFGHGIDDRGIIEELDVSDERGGAFARQALPVRRLIISRAVLSGIKITWRHSFRNATEWIVGFAGWATRRSEMGWRVSRHVSEVVISSG